MQRNFVIRIKKSESDTTSLDSTNCLLLFCNLFRPILT